MSKLPIDDQTTELRAISDKLGCLLYLALAWTVLHVLVGVITAAWWASQ